MSRITPSVIAFLVALAMPLSAFAQDERRTGLVMAAPLHVGVLLPVADRLAVRPGISGYWTSTSFTTDNPATGLSYTSDANSFRLTAGASVLFFLSDDDGLRTYVAPGYATSRVSMTSEGSLSLPGGSGDLSSRKSTETLHEGRVVFGAEQAIGERFRIFGEFGIGVSGTSVPESAELEDSRSRSRSAGTTGAVGVVLFF